MIPQVQVSEATNFAKQWTFKGLAIPLDEASVQFATDFANVCLKSFVEFCAQQAQAAFQKAQEAAKPKVAIE